MNNKKYIFIFLVFLIGSIQSCVKDIDLEFDGFESKLVLNAMVSTELPWNIHLSRTGNRLSSVDSIGDVEYARVIVLDETINQTILLAYDGKGNYKNISISPIAGHDYKITASSTGFSTIQAFTEVPKSVDIVKKDSSSVIVDGVETWNINYEILNEEYQEQFYICELFKIELDAGNNNDHFVESEEVLFLNANTQVVNESREVSSGVRYFFENDQNGTTALTVVSLLDGGDDGDGEGEGDNEVLYQYQLKVKSVSKSFFEYSKALDEWTNNKSNNSSQTQPLSFYSNVENGYGVFSSFNSQYFAL